MKSKLKISAGILLVFISLLGSVAQIPGPGRAINPATGLPISQAQVPVAFDPATGQPIAQPGPEWKDADWKDPEITLTNVDFDGLPLSEVAHALSRQFKEQFDVLLPNQGGGIAYVNSQTVPIGWQHDWSSEPVNLRLKNVTASEIFAAMNLVFENNRTPLRWELKINGHRQIALLRVLIDPTPQVDPIQEKQRRVYFVGNLIGDARDGGMTMEQIINTVTDVWHMAAGGDVSHSGGSVEIAGGRIQFHKEAQLLVVTGTPSQIDFMEQTLKALAQKVDREKRERELKSTPPEKPKLF